MSYSARDMRLYRLPEQLDRTERKLARLRAEYHGLRPEVLASRPHIFSVAFEQAVLTAKKEAQENGEEWSMGVDHAD